MVKNYSILILLLAFSVNIYAQKWEREIYNHTKAFLNSYPEVPNSSAAMEILLVGTFHFRNHKLSVPKVEQQIMDFGAQAIFIEEVPSIRKVDYKEDYKNKLHESSKYGNRFYSNTIDSTISITGVTRVQSNAIVSQNFSQLPNLSNDFKEWTDLITALYVIGDEPNALLQLEYLRQALDRNSDYQKDSVLQTIPAITKKYRFWMGETRYLSVPTAMKLNHSRLYAMDYQVGREETDSVLSIAMKNVFGKIVWRVWKLPYMMKMMKLDNTIPDSDQEALRYFRLLNKSKTIRNMAKVQEIYPYKKNSEASKAWIEAYRKRNYEMVSLVREEVESQKLHKVSVIVGAGHVPHFIYELNRQLPKYKIRLLDIDLLK